MLSSKGKLWTLRSISFTACLGFQILHVYQKLHIVVSCTCINSFNANFLNGSFFKMPSYFPTHYFSLSHWVEFLLFFFFMLHSFKYARIDKLRSTYQVNLVLNVNSDQVACKFTFWVHFEIQRKMHRIVKIFKDSKVCFKEATSKNWKIIWYYGK